MQFFFSKKKTWTTSTFKELRGFNVRPVYMISTSLTESQNHILKMKGLELFLGNLIDMYGWIKIEILVYENFIEGKHVCRAVMVG